MRPLDELHRTIHRPRAATRAASAPVDAALVHIDCASARRVDRHLLAGIASSANRAAPRRHARCPLAITMNWIRVRSEDHCP